MNEQTQAPVYFYSKDLLTQVADQNIALAGKVYGVVAEVTESLQQIFGIEQIPLNPVDMFFEAITKGEDGDVVLRVDWRISQGTVTLVAINPVDGALLGSATLRLASNRFAESFNRIKDADLKAKLSQWFDGLSRIDVSTVAEVGHFYEKNDEAPAPNEPAPAPAPSEVPHVDAELVSEG